MDRIRIVGGRPLNGTIPISGAKNATLPLMIASLLTDQTLILDNVPRLADVELLQRILSNHGVDMMVPGKRPGESQEFGHTIHIIASRIVDTTAPYDLVSKMRASFWVIAPLLARMGEAKVSLPGGCAIGTRPVDLLIMAMEKLGAKIEIDAGYVIARAKDGLKGGEIKFPKVTVSGTHTALMAAVLARGTTVIDNAAQEPEIGDVADCLNKMGARISGIGTSRLIIEGVTRLGGARHRVLPDRIETGTYAMAVAMTGGDVLLEGARPELLQSALDILKQTGAEITETNDGIRVKRNGSGITPVDVDDGAVPRLRHRPAGPVHGADDQGQGHLAHHRDHLREPLHARAGAGAARRPHPARRRDRDRRGRRQAQGRAGDGDRSSRLGVARDRGAGGRRRDHGQPRLSPRPRLRAAGRQARRLRRRDRAGQRLSSCARSRQRSFCWRLVRPPRAQSSLQCSGAQKPWLVADLLFGRGHVSEASLVAVSRHRSDAALSRRLHRARRQRPVARAGRHENLPGAQQGLMIAMPPGADNDAKLQAVIDAYKTRFKQQSVGLIVRPACVSF